MAVSTRLVLILVCRSRWSSYVVQLLILMKLAVLVLNCGEVVIMKSSASKINIIANIMGLADQLVKREKIEKSNPNFLHRIYPFVKSTIVFVTLSAQLGVHKAMPHGLSYTLSRFSLLSHVSPSRFEKNTKRKCREGYCTGT